MHMFLVRSVIIGLLIAGEACSQEISTCPFDRLNNGDMVILGGEVIHGAHDLLLRPYGCANAAILEYGDNQTLGSMRIPLKRDSSFSQFQNYISAEHKAAEDISCSGCWKYTVYAEFHGRLDISPSAGYKRDPQSGEAIGQEGFGHPTPFVRYRLVISSISKVKASDHPLVIIAPEIEHERAPAMK
jgi:hypothetical protein